MTPSPTLVPRAWVVVGRVAVALVWVYEGLVAKLLRGRPDEVAILEQVPLVGGPALGVVIGVGELVLAVLVLTGRWPMAAAGVQTLLLAGFNTGGLIFAGEHITDAVHLLVTNAAFLVLAWGVALASRVPRRSSSAPGTVLSRSPS